MKIKFEKPNKIKANQFVDHIGQVVRINEDNYYLIIRVTSKLYMIDINDFHGKFIDETNNIYDEIKLIESELIIYD